MFRHSNDDEGGGDNGDADNDHNNKLPNILFIHFIKSINIQYYIYAYRICATFYI